MKKIDKTNPEKIKQTHITMLNDQLIDILEELELLERARGKVFEARAYHNASETLMAFPGLIEKIEDVKGLRGIGVKIYKKFEEFVETGKLELLEKERDNPKYIFFNIYGIGPKKAAELVDKDGVKTIKELRERQGLLNDKQKIGLKYYEDILKRIPRKEIEEYKVALTKSFTKIATKEDTFEIVGSFRRGNEHSGDIDMIVSNRVNDNSVLERFIGQLQKDGILLEVLSKGKIKSLTIGRLNKQSIPRRIDFMFSPPKEFAFATLYFTGSKSFNVVQRRMANEQGYSLNEHGLYKFTDKKEGAPINETLTTEEDIFAFLNMIYKEPIERISGKAAILKEGFVAKNKEPKKVIRLKHKKNVKIISSLGQEELNEYWKRLELEGISVLKALKEDYICQMFRYASSIYYNNQPPIVDDTIFDILKNHGQTTYPNNSCFHEIGAPINKEKVQLPYFIGSMSKIKADTNALPKYLKKYPGEKVVSAKLDGISALYSNESGIPRLYTRGQATSGLDISHIIPYLKLPQEKNVAIRGELVISQDVFQAKYADLYKNARNMVSGVIAGSKKHEIDKWKDIDFVAYEVIKPALKPGNQMKWLEQHSIITARYMIVDEISNDLLSGLLVNWREPGGYLYEIDGIIVVDNNIYPRRNHNPEFAFAFKMVLGDQQAEVTVLDIIWTTSKDGYIKPVLQIEKVRIRGADIEFVTAYNAKFVEDNKIAVGSQILLIRSGDIIPKVHKIIKSSEKAQMPTIPWHWNETHVDAISDLVDDPDILQKQIEFFFKKLDVKGVGPGNVKKLINGGFNNVIKILTISTNELLEIDGIKEKTAKKIVDNIKKTLDKSSLSMIASASNIFGRGMGSTIIKNILDEYPDIFKRDDVDVELVAMVDNVSKKRAKLFVSRIPAFIDFMEKSNLMNKFQEPGDAVVDKTNPLYGKRVVITGPKDKSLKGELIALGVKIGSTVNSKTFAVIVESMDIINNKTEAAIKEKIPLLTYSEFRNQYFEI